MGFWWDFDDRGALGWCVLLWRNGAFFGRWCVFWEMVRFALGNGAFCFGKWCVLLWEMVRFALGNGTFCFGKWCVLLWEMVRFASQKRTLPDIRGGWFAHLDALFFGRRSLPKTDLSGEDAIVSDVFPELRLTAGQVLQAGLIAG
jgi:hypothetical protein